MYRTCYVCQAIRPSHEIVKHEVEQHDGLAVQQRWHDVICARDCICRLDEYKAAKAS